MIKSSCSTHVAPHRHKAVHCRAAFLPLSLPAYPVCSHSSLVPRQQCLSQGWLHQHSHAHRLHTLQDLGPCQTQAVHHNTFVCEMEFWELGKNTILQMSPGWVVMLLHSKLLQPSRIKLDQICQKKTGARLSSVLTSLVYAGLLFCQSNAIVSHLMAILLEFVFHCWYLIV